MELNSTLDSWMVKYWVGKPGMRIKKMRTSLLTPLKQEDESNSWAQEITHELMTVPSICIKKYSTIFYDLQGDMVKVSGELSQTMSAKRTRYTSNLAAQGLLYNHSPKRRTVVPIVPRSCNIDSNVALAPSSDRPCQVHSWTLPFYRGFWESLQLAGSLLLILGNKCRKLALSLPRFFYFPLSVHAASERKSR